MLTDLNSLLAVPGSCEIFTALVGLHLIALFAENSVRESLRDQSTVHQMSYVDVIHPGVVGAS